MFELSGVSLKNLDLNHPFPLFQLSLLKLELPDIEWSTKEEIIKNNAESLYNFTSASTQSLSNFATTKERNNRSFYFKYQKHFNYLAEKFTMNPEYFEKCEQLQGHKDLKAHLNSYFNC